MSQQYLMVKARNVLTGQTMKVQDLANGRFTLSQRALAEEAADQFAENLSARTGQSWAGLVETYTPVPKLR